MGMPEITGSDVERSQAITDLIESVALQEAALSHILNAEGEKLQVFIALLDRGSADVTPDTLIEVNNSVTELVTAASSVEGHLQAKLALFAESARVSFYFLKRTDDGDFPLAGAVFELIGDGTRAATATSDNNGIVFFHDIVPGIYTLREVSAPPNFTKDTHTYPVVANAPIVTIDGKPSNQFTVYNYNPAE